MATMQTFKIVLANQATLTGLHNLPAKGPTTPHFRPLIVALHGGTHSARYYDLDAKNSASLASNGLQVPFVAVNRPGYLDSTPFDPIPEGSSQTEQSGEWLHQHILPAIWTEYGEPQSCNCIILHCHSLGTPGAVIAAAKHAAEAEHAYPLGGIIFSGFGTRVTPPPRTFKDGDTHLKLPLEAKFSIMIPPGTADPDVYKGFEHAELNNDMPVVELTDTFTVWLPRWRTEWASKIKVPVMIGIAELDGLWEGTIEHVQEIASAFSGSTRVDGSLMGGAPHNVETSYWSQGWFARGFGFALECAAAFGVGK